jgi:hypothetical protein
VKTFAITLASIVSVAAIAPVVAQNLDRLVGMNVSIAQTTYKGRNAIQVVATPGAINGASYALIKDVSFKTASSKWTSLTSNSIHATEQSHSGLGRAPRATFLI